MQGRKSYTQAEFEQGRAAIDEQLAAYKKLSRAVPRDDKKIDAAFDSFETRFFNSMTLVLDRFFVHRLAGKDYEGKDGNPLNEVRIISDSLVTNGGKLRADKQIELTPERSVLKLRVGEPIKIRQAGFEALSSAFFAELKRRFI